MRKAVFLLTVLLTLLSQTVFAQRKYALVIGNGNYTGISRLNNPVNDANDMEAALRDLGFTVDKVLDGSLTEMENAVIRLKSRLSGANDTYGFFFYAGHGVQSNGANYLIPVGANIPSESFLRERALSVQAMLDELNSAGNELNIVVLDACRDNPFGWSRSGSRGLTVMSNQPADSIIVFATSAGSTAADGMGRNGLFTGHLLTHLRTPGIEVSEMFRLTMADVAASSNNQQRPAVYSQFPHLAWLGSRPEGVATPAAIRPTPLPVQPAPMPVQPADEPRTAPLRAGGSKFLVNVGGGYDFIYTGWALSGSFEYLFPLGLSLGGHVAYSYSQKSTTLSMEIYTDTYEQLSLNAKVAWNFNLRPNIVPYAGLLVGYVTGEYVSDVVNNYWGTTNSSATNSVNSFAAGTNIGLRFFFNDRVGAFIDSSIIAGTTGEIANGFITANLGLAVKY